MLEPTQTFSEVIRIPGAHASLAGKAETALLIVDPNVSAEDLDGVAEAMPTGAIVAATNTLSAWLDETGIPDPDLEKLFGPDFKTLTIVPSVDPERDADAYDAATELVQHIQAVTGGKVAILRMPRSAASFPAFIEARPEESRADFLARTIEAAKPLSKRRPAARPKAVGIRVPEVDWAGARIVAKGGEGMPEEVLMDAAARRLRTLEIWDDLNDKGRLDPKHVHDIEVAVYVSGERREYVVENVPDDQLDHPRAWLRRLPGSAGTDIFIATGRDAGEKIAAAIREADKTLVEKHFSRSRTGWVWEDDEALFLHAGGTIGEAGNTAQGKATLGGDFQEIDLPDPGMIPADEERELAKKNLAVLHELHAESVWASVWGLASHSLAGLGVGATALVYGPPGAGKTTIVQALGAYLSPAFGHDGGLMGSFDGTVAGVSDVGIGLHQAFVTVDDSRETPDSSKQAEEQAQAFDLLARRGYAGGSAGRKPKHRTATGEWEKQGRADRTDVAIVLAGERIPDSSGRTSLIERLWPVEIPTKVAFRSGDANAFIELTSGEDPSKHLAAYLKWLAKQINTVGGLTPWRESWAPVRAELVAKRAPLVEKNRFAQVAAVPELGMRVYLRYCEEAGALTAEERAELEEVISRQFTKIMLRHVSENLANAAATSWEAAIEGLKAAVVTGEAYFDVPKDGDAKLLSAAGARVSERSVYLGSVVHGKDGDYFGIIPRAAVQVLRGPFKSDNDFKHACKPISLKEKGRLTLPVKIGESRLPVVAIPMKYWNGDD